MSIPKFDDRPGGDNGPGSTISAQSVVSGAAADSLARPAQTGRSWIEARLIDTLRATREQVVIDWAAHRRQPDRQHERLTWCPGTPLPDRTLYVTCTATVQP